MRWIFQHPAPTRRRWLTGALAAVLICVALWAAGLVRFAGQIPSGVDDPIRQTDAIVVLTGGSERLATGLRMLAQRRARKLFVSGVHRGVDVAELLRMARQAPDEVECCIVLGHSADDTAGNARETAQWMAAQGYRSLRLVTANYHMQRSLLEFRRAMPEATIVAHPVIPAHVKRRGWWRFPGTASLVVGEYNKLLVALIRNWLGVVSGGREPARAP
ncbi:MAG: YdcF family protein [Kiloniellales bacterium]